MRLFSLSLLFTFMVCWSLSLLECSGEETAVCKETTRVVCPTYSKHRVSYDKQDNQQTAKCSLSKLRFISFQTHFMGKPRYVFPHYYLCKSHMSLQLHWMLWICSVQIFKTTNNYPSNVNSIHLHENDFNIIRINPEISSQFWNRSTKTIMTEFSLLNITDV